MPFVDGREEQNLRVITEVVEGALLTGYLQKDHEQLIAHKIRLAPI